MRTRFASVLAALAVAVLTFTASPAHAASWTVSGSPTGTFTGHGSTTTVTNPVGFTLSCAESEIEGTAFNGTYASGTDIAQINGLTFTNCTGPLGIACTISISGLPWAMNMETPISGGGTGTIDGIVVRITCTGCDATFSGSASITFTNTTGTNATLTVRVRLTATNVNTVNNCFGLIHVGDVLQFTIVYAIMPDTLEITGA